MTMTNSTLESLLKKHHNEAYLWSYQCCHRQEDDAKDVLQLVYLKVLEGKATFKEQSSFKTWLFSVIRFTAIDHFKKQQKHVSLDGIVIVEKTKDDADENNYRAILMQLPERQQQILTLAFYHQMTLAEIAEVKNLHIGTVRTHYERGKESLRKRLKK